MRRRAQGLVAILLLVTVAPVSAEETQIWLVEEMQGHSRMQVTKPADAFCSGTNDFGIAFKRCRSVPTVEGIRTWREEDRQQVADTLASDRKAIVALVAALQARIDSLEQEVQTLRDAKSDGVGGE